MVISNHARKNYLKKKKKRKLDNTNNLVSRKGSDIGTQNISSSLVLLPPQNNKIIKTTETFLPDYASPLFDQIQDLTT
jgi:hypothetical protein